MQSTLLIFSCAMVEIENQNEDEINVVSLVKINVHDYQWPNTTLWKNLLSRKYQSLAKGPLI